MVEGQLSCHLLQTVSIQKHERIYQRFCLEALHLSETGRRCPKMNSGSRVRASEGGRQLQRFRPSPRMNTYANILATSQTCSRRNHHVDPSPFASIHP